MTPSELPGQLDIVQIGRCFGSRFGHALRALVDPSVELVEDEGRPSFRPWAAGQRLGARRLRCTTTRIAGPPAR